MHYLYLFFIVCLASCKSVEPTTQYNATQHYTTLHNAVDTIALRDSVVLRDSVIFRERTVHDTVYITKEVYRDRLEARGERRKAERTDTVVVTEYRDRVIEHPPEKYVPKFYKWCTMLLWAIVLIGALVIGYRIWRRLWTLTH